MDFSNMDILLVDDNPINLKVLHDSLKGLDCKVYIASDGEDALSILDKTTPSLAILDIMMPGMSGFELCEKMKEQERLSNVPVVFITALNDTESEAKAFDLGAVDFITKPINPPLVKARIHSQLKLKYYQDILKGRAETKEQQFFSLIDNAPDAILLINYNERSIIMANKAAETLYGITNKEILNLKLADIPVIFSPGLQADGLDSVKAARLLFEKVVRGELTSFEWIFRSKDGQIIPTEIRLIYLPGEEPLIRASITDISARKEKEEALNSAHNYINNIMNSMPLVLIGFNDDLEVTHWNIRAKEYSGIGMEDAIGENIMKLIPHIKLEKKLIKESISNNVIKRKHKKSRITSNGTIYENITIFPISDRNTRGAVLLIDDITDQVELQGMVIQSERMFSIGEMASGVAHEITNPLAGIIQNGQSLISRLTSDLPGNVKAAEKYNINLNSLKLYLEDRKIIQMIESIRTSGLKASHIIKNLSNFSKKDVGNLTYNSVEPLINQSLALAANDYNIESGYDFKDIKVVKSIPEELPLILCEPSKIIQVFLNLYRFAIKNIGKGHKSPEINIAVLQEDHMVSIDIQDNGEPLSSNEIEALMQPYFKGKPTVREEWYSLSLAHFIISDVHNGNLQIKSDNDYGNIVKVSIPISN